ncbi:hypothetical protein Tco_1439555 [Tanacetum coccineum]
MNTGRPELQQGEELGEGWPIRIRCPCTGADQVSDQFEIPLVESEDAIKSSGNLQEKSGTIGITKDLLGTHNDCLWLFKMERTVTTLEYGFVPACPTAYTLAGALPPPTWYTVVIVFSFGDIPLSGPWDYHTLSM